MITVCHGLFATIALRFEEPTKISRRPKARRDLKRITHRLRTAPIEFEDGPKEEGRPFILEDDEEEQLSAFIELKDEVENADKQVAVLEMIERSTDGSDMGSDLEDTEDLDTIDSDLVMEEAEITEKHKDEEGAEAVQKVVEITEKHFIELVEDASVFTNCKSWEIKYHAKENDVFMPLCTPKHYNGYDMIPVFGGGAIQADLVRPCPAAVVTSSVRCLVHGMCMHISYAPHFNANQTNIESDKSRTQAIRCWVCPKPKPGRDRDREEGAEGQEIATSHGQVFEAAARPQTSARQSKAQGHWCLVHVCACNDVWS